MHLERQQKLARLLAEQNIDALALNAGPSLTYLSGLHFHLSERPVVLLLVPGKELAVILPELEQAKLTDRPYLPYTYSENPDTWREVFSQACRSLGLTGCRIGVEPNRLRLLEYNLLVEAADTDNFVDVSESLASLRSVKSDAELACMRTAVDIAEKALTATLGMVKVGATEREVASELMLHLLRNGADPSLPFSPIVASGPHGSNPHAIPTDRRLSDGDLVIIDWGASYHGYASDLTRTFGLGSVSQENKEIHEIVRRANAAARSTAGPGVSCSAIDKAARDVIKQAGFGTFFTHRTGHGIGMECHEPPYIRDDNGQPLEVGMTFTIEPGIYLPGNNGVRIEDDVVITRHGAQSLSTISRELIIID